MQNELFIDTASNEKIIVGLISNGKELKIEHRIDRRKAQAVLPMVDDIVKKQSVLLSDLASIRVNTGPGSFTGVRVGISVANALSFALNVPINHKKRGELAKPTYE